MSHFSYPRQISIITGLAAFAVYFTISSVTLTNPVIAHVFHIGAKEMGLVIQAHLLGAIMFLIPAGRLGDRYGHIKIFTCGSIIFAVSSLLCGLSDSGIQIIFFRFIQGTGDGIIIATSLVLLTRTFSDKKRGKAFGFFLLAGYVGYVCGMIPEGLAAEFFGWQTIFFLTVPLTLASGLIALRLWKKRGFNEYIDKDITDKKFDLFGMLLFCPAVILITAGISDIISFNARIILVLGFLILAVFMFWEKKARNPLFKPEIFQKNRLFVFSLLADLLYYITTGCIVFTLSIYLENGLLHSAFLTGIILIPSSLIQGALSPYAGHLSDKIEPRYITAAGMIIISATLLFYSNAGYFSNVTAISLMLAVTGSGLALFSSPNKNAVMSSVKKEFQGEASGIANTFEQTGNIISISIAALIITFFAGTSEITSENLPEFIESMHVIFLTMAFLGVITAIICLKRGNLR